MPTLVFPIADVLQRLKAVDAIRIFGLAPDLTAALATPPRSAPALYVTSSTRGGKPLFSGPLIQEERETTISLVEWVQNHGAPEKVAAEAQEIEAAIAARCAGWKPTDAFTALRLVSARDEFSHAAYLVRQITYASSWTFSAQRQA